MQPVKWGIIGVARIGMEKVIPAMQQAPGIEIVGIASRDAERAEAARQELGIAKAYGSYEALLADPEIEAVYNPLPNHLHVPWTKKALEAGKHVLCEKPLGMNAHEAATLIEARDKSGKLLQEAFMVKCHPQWLKAKALIEAGRIGEARAASGIFCYHNDDPANVRNQADIGGGGIMDIGCYMTLMSRWMLGAEPERVVALIDRDPNFHTDRLASALFDFGDGRQAAWTTSTQLAPAQRFTVLGTKGRITVEIPCNAPPDRPCRITVDDGRDLFAGGEEVIEIPTCNQYGLQGTMFSKAVRGQGQLAMTMEDSIANMKVLDALFASESKGGWVEV
jgi:predicted dehydrogenase